MPEPVFPRTEAKDRQVRQVRWNFSGEVVLVTASSRTSQSARSQVARAGANLALCDIGHDVDSITYPMGTAEELEETARECRKLGATVLTTVCDVRDDRQVDAFVESAVSKFGRIDVAIANAGVAGIVEAVDMTEAEWDDLVDINLKGVFLTVKHCARRMIEQGGGGSLIATGSVHCFTGVPGGSPLCRREARGGRPVQSYGN